MQLYEIKAVRQIDNISLVEHQKPTVVVLCINTQSPRKINDEYTDYVP